MTTESSWLDYQNSEEAVDWLKAASEQYGRAKTILGFRAAVGVLVPVVLAIARILAPSFGVAAASYGIVVSVLDLLAFEPLQKRSMKRGALAQESFDCLVLRLPWHHARCGIARTVADRIEWSRSYRGRVEELINWYPKGSGHLLIDYGRLICQLSNCRWDKRLRERYASFLLWSTLLVVIIITAIALILDARMRVLVLTIAALLPAIIWTLRGWSAQTEAIEQVDDQRAQIEDLWRRALTGQTSQTELSVRSRAIQDEIFSRRKGSQPVFNWVYRRFKTGDETSMVDTADAMVEEFRDSVSGQNGPAA